MRFIPLDANRHRQMGWSPQSDYGFAAKQNLIPAVAAELESLVAQYPLAFVKEDNSYRLMVVASVNPNENAFVTDDGRWMVGYKPAFIRAYPFRQMGLANQPGANGRKSVLSIFESALQPLSDAKNPLFDNQGQPTDRLKQVAGFCQQIEESRAQLQRSVDALAGAGLIKPWPLQQQRDGEQQVIEGLHQIDEPALLNCSGDLLARFSQMGALSVAYGQLYSRKHLMLFPRLERVKARYAAAQGEASAPAGLDGFLDDEDDDHISFDFDRIQ